MPVQSQVITCSAGAWTSIAEQMDLRQALMVQCPEAATTQSYAKVSMVVGSAVSAALANVLRKQLRFVTNESTIVTVVSQVQADAAATFGIEIPLVSSTNSFGLEAPLDSQWGSYIQNQWFVSPSSGVSFVGVWEEIWTCRAVILGINKSGPTYTGPYGIVPMGLWTSPDLSGGPAIFRLSKDRDFDLTTQEWFAWPVGSGKVNVQVFQSFDLPPETTDDAYKPLTVQIPRLSPWGKQAAVDLLAAMTPKVQNATVHTDDEEF